jgi:hypothetical protein
MIGCEGLCFACGLVIYVLSERIGFRLVFIVG